MNIVNSIDPSYLHLGGKYKANITVLVDCSILNDDTYDNSVAFLSEPNHILSYYLGNNVNVFEEISKRLKTGNHRFKKLYTAFRYFEGHPNTQILDHTPLPSWISSEESGIPNKSTNLVFITSTKGWTPQQRQRVHLADWLQQIDVPVYGRGYKQVERKADVLRDARFCICIENESLDGYHTEKLVDCFKTGTVPLYVGDPNVVNTYDPNGMFVFESVSELMKSDVFMMLLDKDQEKSRVLYESMFDSVINNYDTYMRHEPFRKAEYLFDMINGDCESHE